MSPERQSSRDLLVPKAVQAPSLILLCFSLSQGLWTLRPTFKLCMYLPNVALVCLPLSHWRDALRCLQIEQSGNFCGMLTSSLPGQRFMKPGLGSDLGRRRQKRRVGCADIGRLASSAPPQVSLETSEFKALIQDVFIGLLRFFQPLSLPRVEGLAPGRFHVVEKPGGFSLSWKVAQVFKPQYLCLSIRAQECS